MDWLARFLTPSRRQQLGSGSACVTLKSLQAEPGPWLGEGTQRLRMRSQGRGAVVDSRERASWATLAGVLFYQALRALTSRIPGLGQQGEADARGCCCSWREALAACLPWSCGRRTQWAGWWGLTSAQGAWGAKKRK